MGYWEIVVGGTPLNLDSFGCYVEAVQGAGVPPLNNISLDYAQGDGALYQQTFAKTRTLTLQLYVPGSSLANLHALRKALWDALKPNRVPVQQPAVLRYSGGGTRTVQINAVYDPGLEWTQLEGFSERLPLRFLAYDPFWYATGMVSGSLAVQTSVANANSILQRDSTGQWNALGTGTNGQVWCLLQDQAGNIYAGGTFTSPGQHVAKWNGSAWSALGTGVGGNVNCLALGPDAALYVGGSFVDKGNYIAKYSGGVWSTLGSGLNGTPLSMCFGPDGILYVAGIFTTAGGSAAQYVAKWNGSAWSAMGSLSGGGGAILYGSDGRIYSAGSTASAYSVGRWNGTSWDTIGAVTTGASPGNISALVTGLDGAIYAAGHFDTIGGVSANSVARWNGAAWQALSAGLGGVTNVNSLGVDSTGVLWAAGSFTNAGALATPLTDSLARWSGSGWYFPDVDTPGTANVYAVIPKDGKLTIGFTTSGTATAAAISTLTNNGTADAFPVLIFTGPGTIYQAINTTTGDELLFNLTLLTGETATLDLTPGNKTFVSSFRGNIIGTLIPGSDVATFRLIPGSNTISTFISNASATVSVSWRERYWSLDGSA